MKRFSSLVREELQHRGLTFVITADSESRVGKSIWFLNLMDVLFPPHLYIYDFHPRVFRYLFTTRNDVELDIRDEDRVLQAYTNNEMYRAIFADEGGFGFSSRKSIRESIADIFQYTPILPILLGVSTTHEGNLDVMLRERVDVISVEMLKYRVAFVEGFGVVKADLVRSSLVNEFRKREFQVKTELIQTRVKTILDKL